MTKKKNNIEKQPLVDLYTNYILVEDKSMFNYYRQENKRRRKWYYSKFKDYKKQARCGEFPKFIINKMYEESEEEIRNNTQELLKNIDYLKITLYPLDCSIKEKLDFEPCRENIEEYKEYLADDYYNTDKNIVINKTTEQDFEDSKRYNIVKCNMYCFKIFFRDGAYKGHKIYTPYTNIDLEKEYIKKELNTTFLYKDLYNVLGEYFSQDDIDDLRKHIVDIISSPKIKVTDNACYKYNYGFCFVQPFKRNVDFNNKRDNKAYQIIEDNLYMSKNYYLNTYTKIDKSRTKNKAILDQYKGLNHKQSLDVNDDLLSSKKNIFVLYEWDW